MQSLTFLRKALSKVKTAPTARTSRRTEKAGKGQAAGGSSAFLFRSTLNSRSNALPRYYRHHRVFPIAHLPILRHLRASQILGFVIGFVHWRNITLVHFPIRQSLARDAFSRLDNTIYTNESASLLQIPEATTFSPFFSTFLQNLLSLKVY